MTTGPITAQVLSGADVLVLAAPDKPLAPAENQAITTFVQSDGGLMFLICGIFVKAWFFSQALTGG